MLNVAVTPFRILLALLAGSLVFAAPVQARITEIGATGDQAIGAPACPRDCIAMTKTTGYQAKVGPTRGLYTVPRDGRIVAWTITLGNPGPSQIKFFNENYDGVSKAGIVVLRTGERLFGRTIAVSPIKQLEPFFGKSAQFALPETIVVHKGEVIALNVATWAPSLAVGLGPDTSWRASREDKCTDQTTTGLQTSQELNSLAQYRCLYQTARLTYSATLISTP